MRDPDLIRLFITPLEQLSVPYMITGGVASVVYGDPRFTRDVDIVLELRESDVDRFAGAFSGDEFYAPPKETLVEECNRPRHGHFNVIHRDTTLRADIYLMGDDPLHIWAMNRRSTLAFDDGRISMAPIEYVVLRKLEYYRSSGSERHLRDVAMMLRVSGEMINQRELDEWIERLSLRAALEAAEAFEV